MAYVIKRNRAYEYRSVRRGGKVTSVYVGGGSISAESATFFHELEAGRRSERAMDRAEWEAERGHLAEVEREIVETDAAYEELATAALVAAGFHRPQRGRWRRRRAMKTGDMSKGGESTEGRPIDTPAEIEGLLDQIERAEGEEKFKLDRQARKATQLLLDEARMGLEAGLPALRVVVRRRPDFFGKIGLVDYAMRAMAAVPAGGRDVFLPEVLVKEMEDMRSELAGPAPSPLERVLAERIALAWFDVTEADRRWAGASAGGCPLDQAEFHQRYRSRANQRFLAACKALATVRRLALPVLQVNLGGAAPAKPPRIPGYAGGLDRCLSSRAD